MAAALIVPGHLKDDMSSARIGIAVRDDRPRRRSPRRSCSPRFTVTLKLHDWLLLCLESSVAVQVTGVVPTGKLGSLTGGAASDDEQSAFHWCRWR